MLAGTWIDVFSFIAALLCGPESGGSQMVADLTSAE
jgi:hypothetical protein